MCVTHLLKNFLHPHCLTCCSSNSYKLCFSGWQSENWQLLWGPSHCATAQHESIPICAFSISQITYIITVSIPQQIYIVSPLVHNSKVDCSPQVSQNSLGGLSMHLSRIVQIPTDETHCIHHIWSSSCHIHKASKKLLVTGTVNLFTMFILIKLTPREHRELPKSYL